LLYALNLGCLALASWQAHSRRPDWTTIGLAVTILLLPLAYWFVNDMTIT
jgi:hypothetical protein